MHYAPVIALHSLGLQLGSISLLCLPPPCPASSRLHRLHGEVVDKYGEVVEKLRADLKEALEDKKYWVKRSKLCSSRPLFELHIAPGGPALS